MADEKLRIAVIMSWLPSEGNWGGVGYQAHRLANILVKRGHTVDVFTATPGPEDALYNIIRIASDEESKNKWFMTFKFPIRVARQDYSGYDVIHAHGDNQWLRTKVPVVRTFHGSALAEAFSSRSPKRCVSQLWLYLCEIICMRRSSACVANSEATARRFRRVRKAIPCGVDLTEFSPGEKSPQPSILFVGYLDGRKRGQLLVEVFCSEIRERVPGAELWMVSQRGEPQSGVKWCGKPDTPTIVQLYRKAWVFCMPSTYEGFGVPYIEAMASGTPVVTSPNPGAGEVLHGGRYGMIVDDRQLSSAITGLLLDAETRASAAAAGLEHARNFSFDAVADEYERTFLATLSGACKAKRF